jgi:hypothetical protein
MFVVPNSDNRKCIREVESGITLRTFDNWAAAKTSGGYMEIEVDYNVGRIVPKHHTYLKISLKLYGHDRN